MTKIQQFIIIVALIIVKNLFSLTSLIAMLNVGSLQKQLPLPINWLPDEVSQSGEVDQEVNKEKHLDHNHAEVSDDPDLSCVQCSICTENFRVRDALGIFSGCRHGFHVGCILPWLAQSQICPNCNQPTSDMRILVLTKSQGGIPEIIATGEKAFRTMLEKLGSWGQPLVSYFNALPPKKKAFYSIMSALGIVLVAYLAYKWWTTESVVTGGSSLDATPELVELATSYK